MGCKVVGNQEENETIQKKRITKNWIIKLFKITDCITAEKFEMENCVLTALRSIENEISVKADEFAINFIGLDLTLLNEFKKALKE